MSASIPSFFNRIDFYGTLLPGYLIILIYFFLYQPTVLFKASANSLNLLWTIIFLVAGPVVGLLLSEAGDIVEWYLWRYTRGRNATVKIGDRTLKWNLRLNTFSYYWTRIHAQNNELGEIDFSEANYNFGISAGAGLFGLGLSKLYYSHMDTWAAAFVLAGAILLVGAWYEYQAFAAVMAVVWERHHLSFPEELLRMERPPPPAEAGESPSKPS